MFAEKKTESTHYYLDILEGIGNDFTELETGRHQRRLSNYAFADASVRRIKHPDALIPVNLFGITDWGRQGLLEAPVPDP